MASCIQLYYLIFILYFSSYKFPAAAYGWSLSNIDSRNGGYAERQFVNKVDSAALQQPAHDPVYEDSSTQRALEEQNERFWQTFLASPDKHRYKELRGAGINQNEAQKVCGEESKRGKRNPSSVVQVRKDGSGLPQSKDHAHWLTGGGNFWRGRDMQLLRGGTGAWRGKREHAFPLRDALAADLRSFQLENPDEVLRNVCCKGSDHDQIDGDAEANEEMLPKGGITAWRGKDFGKAKNIDHLAKSDNR